MQERPTQHFSPLIRMKEFIPEWKNSVQSLYPQQEGTGWLLGVFLFACRILCGVFGAFVPNPLTNGLVGRDLILM